MFLVFLLEARLAVIFHAKKDDYPLYGHSSFFNGAKFFPGEKLGIFGLRKLFWFKRKNRWSDFSVELHNEGCSNCL